MNLLRAKALTAVVTVMLILPVSSVAQSVAQVGSDIYSQEARRIVERLAGTKVAGDHPLVIEAAEALKSGDRLAAARAGTKHPNFLSSTVKLMALKLSTRDETMSLLLNDFAATFIGVTRDNIDARQLLTGNFYYVGDPNRYLAQKSVGLTAEQISKIPALPAETDLKFVTSNDHYNALEHTKIDIGTVLVRRNSQKILGRRAGAIVDGRQTYDDYIATNPDPAGVLTSRTFIREHADAGTNRRLVEYAFREFMCVPLEEWADAGASDAWVGRDIDRFPGGDHQKYQTSCKACHSVMDAFRPAFGKWNESSGGAAHSGVRVADGNFNGTTGIANKMNKNSETFPGGFVTRSDDFVNNSFGAANAQLFGWRDYSTGGKGVAGFGRALAHSKRFSQCMVKRVYDATCRTNVDMKANAQLIDALTENFEKQKYNLRQLFEQVAIQPSCIGVK